MKVKREKVISINSLRGGTGKSLIAINLAFLFAKKGLNVSILDLDFRAPTLYTLFEGELQEYTTNDFLNNKCSIEDVLVDVSGKYKLKGRLFVGLADPSLEAIHDMINKDSKWEMRALQRLLSLKSTIRSLGLDYIIYDTSPGILYSSINAAASSDIPILVSTVDNADIAGTRRMIKEIYSALEKKVFVLLNKFVSREPLSESGWNVIIRRFENTLKSQVIGIIPCFCDVLEVGYQYIFALNRPEHPFVKNLEAVAERINTIK